jgi:Zn-dependent protease with chaperone function
MPLVLIFFLLIACATVPWPPPWSGADPVWALVFTGILTIMALVRAKHRAGRVLGLLNQPFRQSEAFMEYARGRTRQNFLVMVLFAIALYLGGWGWLVQSVCVNADGVLWPGAELIILAPFFVSMIGSWCLFYPIERAVHIFAGEPAPSRWQFLRFQFRQQLAIACLPVGLIIFEQSLARLFPQVVETTWFKIGAIATIFGVLILSPLALKWLLGLYPLPASPLRDRLMAAARRMKFRYTDLLVWPTQGNVGNAMIAGLLPWPRYVLFTDRLLHELNSDEIEAVLGHEVGHVRHHHLAFYVVFLGLSLSVLTGLANFADRQLAITQLAPWLVNWLGDWQALIALLVMAVYVVFAFGFLSRRCEREADLFGCRAVSCGRPNCQHHDIAETHATVSTSSPPCATGIDVFTSALERVAVMNGLSRSKPGWLASWQHGSIARRVAFLDRVRRDLAVDRSYCRRLFVFKVLLLAGLGAAVISFIVTKDLQLPW